MTTPPDLETLRARLHQFLIDEVAPAEREHTIHDEGDASHDLLRWLRRRSAELGFYRLLQSSDVGGGGLGAFATVVLYETIGASGTVLGRFALGGDGGLLNAGTPEQRERLLLPVLRGELDAALAFTDAREGPRTTAVRRGQQFLVSGVKSFVTGGPHADLLLTVARVVENEGGPTGSAIFVVRRDAPGVTLRRAKRTLEGALHGEFELKDVAVEDTDVLGAIGDGVPKALRRIAAVRLAIAATACGLGRWALERALADVSRPHRSGTPLAEREQVQAMLGESTIDLYGAWSATCDAAQRADAGVPADDEATIAKVLATEAVTRIVDRAIQLSGGAAVVEDHPLAIAYRRIRSWRIAEGTTEVLRLTIARAMLGKSGAG